jgi:hypothetical protein
VGSLLTAVAALATLALAAAAPAAGPQYFLTTYHDQVIGVRTVTASDVDVDGRAIALTEVDDQTRLSARGVTTRTITRRREYTDADGYGVSLSETRLESGQRVETEIAVDEGAVLFRTVVAGRRQAFRARRDGPVLFDLDGEALARRGMLAVGRSLKEFVVARVELGIAQLEVTVVGRFEDEAGGERFRLSVSNVNGAGEPWEIVCDGAGRTVELRIGPMVMRRVAREQARLPRIAPVLENRIPTEPVVRLDEVRRMRLFVTVAADVRTDVFARSMYVEPWREPDGRFRLTLSEARPDGRLERAELSDRDRARFLSASPLVESDAPAIARTAEDVAGGEDEPLVKALRLTRWVYRTLSKRSTGPATASALEALRAGAGDCTEHAALFTALARAAGIPARQALGLVHDGTGFQFHAWAEVHASDQWVPADPTLGRLGVPGIYILLGREGELIEYHSRANALQGRTQMMLIDTQ